MPQTSPSPCAACASPAEKSAPSTGIGRKSVVPATSSLQSMFPPQRRGGIVECTPAPAAASRARRGTAAARRRRAPERPRPSGEAPAHEVRRLGERHAPGAGLHSSILTASVCPARAPRTSIGPGERVTRVEHRRRATRTARRTRAASRRSALEAAPSRPDRRHAPARGRARSARAGGGGRAEARAAPLELEQPAHRVETRCDRGHVRVLDLPVRVRDVVAGHAQHRAAQVEDRLLGEDRRELGGEPAACAAPPARSRRARSSRPTRAAPPRRAASASGCPAPRPRPRRRARRRRARRAAPSSRTRRASRRCPRARGAPSRAGRRARPRAPRRGSSGSAASARARRPDPGRG